METFKVILEGRCLPTFDPAQVRTELAKLVGQTEAVAGQLLAGREVVVKSRVDIVTSTRYVEALRSIGVVSRVAPDGLELDDDLGVRLTNAGPAIEAVGPRHSRVPDKKQLPRAVTPPQHGRSTSKQTNAFGRFVLLGMAIAVVVGGYAALTYSGPASKDVSTPVSAPAPVQHSATAPAQQVPAHEAHNPSAGISRSGPDAIVLDGEISRAMAVEFDFTIRELRAELGYFGLIVVYLNSKGGDLAAAMDIGRSIRNDGNSVVFVWDDKVCFSSCVFILAGGEQRIRRGRIGIHRPYLAEPISDGAAIKRWYERLSTDAKTYLREMNVRESLFDDMVSIPPEHIHIFQSTEEMDHYGLLADDPVAAEQGAAAEMRRYGITTKSLLFERRQRSERECNGLPTNQVISCIERVMRGG